MNIFNSIKVPRVKKSMFDLTHDVKLSCNMGQLVPVLTMPVVPGDHVQLRHEIMVRLAPTLAPLYHMVHATVHTFFVPNRILWPNWETFITGKNLTPGSASLPPALPVYDLFSATGQTPEFQLLADYMGIPPTAGQGWDPVTDVFNVSALPFAAYARIWYEYYRDQNQQFPDTTAANLQLADGVNVINPDYTQIKNRAWEHDYFTAALPWAQKGPAVMIPTLKGDDGGTAILDADGNAIGAVTPLSTNANSELQGGGQPLQVAMGTMNDLRTAEKLQVWLETNATAGTRYKESLIGHWNVNSSDKRLQRPEYITGLKTPVIISEVLNTTGGSTGTADTAQGTMTGHGVALNSGDAGQYFVEEHGYIISILSVMPKTAYQQGVPKDFIKYDYLDFGFPEFGHLGEQAIDLNEIAAYLQAPDPGEAWGYIPRYAEYKFMMSRVAGDFRSSLNFWHMGRIFDTPPGLDAAFIVSDPTTRIFAVTDPVVQHLWVQVLHHIKALRPFPKYGKPGW